MIKQLLSPTRVELPFFQDKTERSLVTPRAALVIFLLILHLEPQSPGAAVLTEYYLILNIKRTKNYNDIIGGVLSQACYQITS